MKRKEKAIIRGRPFLVVWSAMERTRGERARWGGRLFGLTVFGVGLVAGYILMLLGVQLATLLGDSLQSLLDDEQLTTTPWSPPCVSTARQFSVPRLENPWV